MVWIRPSKECLTWARCGCYTPDEDDISAVYLLTWYSLNRQAMTLPVVDLERPTCVIIMRMIIIITDDDDLAVDDDGGVELGSLEGGDEEVVVLVRGGAGVTHGQPVELQT